MKWPNEQKTLKCITLSLSHQKPKKNVVRNANIFRYQVDIINLQWGIMNGKKINRFFFDFKYKCNNDDGVYKKTRPNIPSFPEKIVWLALPTEF